MAFVEAARVVAPASLKRLLALACIAFAAACASTPEMSAGLPHAPAAGSPSAQKIGRPYQVNGIWYVPAREDDYDEVGIASWYGPGFHGRSTANGERFDETLITAAHTTLPLPSIVHVRNLENGREIVARLNDRGPFVDDRIIDLSRAAARELGFERAGTARVRVRYLGAADSYAGGMSSGARITPVAARSSDEIYRPEPPAIFAPAVRGGSLYVQVASFRERDRALALMRRLGEGGPVIVTRARVDGHTWHRVMIGPWRDARGAQQARQAVVRMGFSDARIVNRD